MVSMEPGISFTAIFQSAKTTQDGGWRVSFDISEDESAKVAQVACLKGGLLQLAVVPIEAGLKTGPNDE